MPVLPFRVLVLVLASAPSLVAQWTVTNLHPPGATFSMARGVHGNHVVGEVDARAILWNAPWTSRIDLTPSGALAASAAAAHSDRQVGHAHVGGIQVASLWNGTAGSWVNLRPGMQSFATGIDADQQVGVTLISGTIRASLWSGTAASHVDLHPAGWTGSNALAVQGGQQAGFARSGSLEHASVWNGSAASWIDLHPPALGGNSNCFGVHQGQQVGIANGGASLWSSSAASMVNLSPPGTWGSTAYGLHGSLQVGSAFTTFTVQHASLWSGSASSWVDLHAFLPPEFDYSIANAVWHDDNVTYVVGYANNLNTGRVQAILWTGPAPQATSIAGTGVFLPFSGDGGQATVAGIGVPTALTADPLGNVFFIARDPNQTGRIRRIDALTGVITTVCGGGSIPYPNDGILATDAQSPAFAQQRSFTCLTLDRHGNVYFGEKVVNLNLVRRIDAVTKRLSTVAGGVPDTGGIFPTDDDGLPATSASLRTVRSLAFDRSGNLLLLDPYRVRRVNAATGIITSVAGNLAQVQQPGGGYTGVYSGDGGPATSAGFVTPEHITVDGHGNLFVSEIEGYTGGGNGRIRRVDASTGIITTIAGSSGPIPVALGDNGPALGAKLDNNLFGLTPDPAGNLLVSHLGAIRKVDTATGIISRLVGTGVSSAVRWSGFLQFPRTDGYGNLYCADGANYRIVKVTRLVTNLPPTAVPGSDQSIHASELVQFDGTGSFDDNSPAASLLYCWSVLARPNGSSAALAGAETPTPTLAVDLLGDYEIELVVTDGSGLRSLPAVVRVSSTNLPPVANAGADQGALVLSTVNLNGTGSTDPENDPLSFSWALVAAPLGSTAVLAGNLWATPALVPDLPGTYTVRLVVSDGFVTSPPDDVVVTVITGQQYAEVTMTTTVKAVEDLDEEDVTNPGNQEAFTRFVYQAIALSQSGQVAEAMSKIGDAMIRCDGWTLRNALDTSGPGRDWITDRDAAMSAYAQLLSVLNALTP